MRLEVHAFLEVDDVDTAKQKANDVKNALKDLGFKEENVKVIIIDEQL